MFTKKYDWLIVGSGLFGATFAREMQEVGKRVLVIEKDTFVGGQAATKKIGNVMAHLKGPHYFHTNNRAIWDYVNKFAEFNHYQAKVNAQYKGKIFSLPFSMYTFNQLWGCKTLNQARQKIEEQIIKNDTPKNLEEFALATVGTDIYEILIKGYSEKQWGRSPKHIPASIIKRIPVRFTFNNNYHTSRYAGVPIKGYTHMVENMISGIDLKLNSDFFDIKDWTKIAHNLLYTGPIDRFFKYKYGPLEYRSLRFQHILTEDFQGIGQVNYTDLNIPYTRTIEHKHFYENPEKHLQSPVTFEYPDNWDLDKEPYYPINDTRNIDAYKKYKEEAIKANILIEGRLGSYRYLDMDQVIARSKKLANLL